MPSDAPPPPSPPPAPQRPDAEGGSFPLWFGAVLRTLRVLSLMAATAAPILMVAPRADGVSLLARALHLRAAGVVAPFVPVRCGLYPGRITARRLLGGGTHRRSFIRRRRGDDPGGLVAAQGGTLFLEQVQHVPPPVQDRLLPILERVDQAAGGAAGQAAEPRIIATADGVPAAGQKALRPDVWHRLSRVTVEIPELLETHEGLAAAVAAVDAWLTTRAEADYPRASTEELRALVDAIRTTLDQEGNRGAA